MIFILYFKITCQKKNIDYKEKQNIFLKFFTTNEKKGFIEKFNHALGFKKYSIYRENGLIIDSEYELFDSFLTPEELLNNNFYIEDFYDNKEIITFYIPEGKQYHPTTKMTYDNFDMAFKFTLFLKKIFPSLDIYASCIEKDIYKDNLYKIKKNVLFSKNEECLSFERLLDIPLSLNELKDLYTYMNYAGLYNYEYIQSYCSCMSCKFSSTPYMTELAYSYELNNSYKKNKKVSKNNS